MISHLFTTAFTIRRIVYSGGGAIGSLEDAGGFNGHVQQLQGPDVQNVASGMTVTHRIWCALAVDVQRGDTLSDGTNSYSVRTVQRNADGLNAHLELLVELDLETSV